MNTTTMVATTLMNLLAVCVTGMFAVVARYMPDTALRSWALYAIVMLVATLLTVRVNRLALGDDEGESVAPWCRWLATVSQVLLVLAWAAVIAIFVQLTTL
ncbi:MAG: hypothetical protein ACP5KN_14185 [Armatimonadota bacterium]